MLTRERKREARDRENARPRARASERTIPQKNSGLENLPKQNRTALADSGSTFWWSGHLGQLNRTDSSPRTRLTNRPQNGQTLSRSLLAYASLLYRAHPVARRERWPATLRLPRFSANSCPTSMQLFIYFSDLKNIKS
jgi:hypothetical protein